MSTHAAATTQAAVVPTITRAPETVLQRTCACGEHTTAGGECEECKKKAMLWRRHGNGFGPAVAPPIVHDVLRSPGQVLDGDTREFFEARFGCDLSHVRVHSDLRAAESARAVGAHAYTVGRHVVFGEGRYSPQSSHGRSLLSHELTHVVQQSASPDPRSEIRIGEATCSAEREADQAERESTVAEPLPVEHRTPAKLQGKWDWKRAAKGAAIGLGAGIVAGLAANARSAPGYLVAGLVGGGLLAGFVIGGATGSEEPSCGTEKKGVIATAVKLGLSMLQVTIAAITALTPGARASDRVGRAGEALRLYFKSDARAVANYVRQRLVEIQHLLTAVRQRIEGSRQDGEPRESWAPAIDCRKVGQDDSCQGSTEAYASELQPGETQRQGMVFCPKFFENKVGFPDEHRATVLIHELAHVLAPGKNKEIGDRAYTHQRFFPDLTTAEALTNADSYRVFVEHVAGKFEPLVGHEHTDLVEGCNEGQEAQISSALHRGQRWVSVALRAFAPDLLPRMLTADDFKAVVRRHLGGVSAGLVGQAAKAYENAAGPLAVLVQARCHPTPDAVCPAGTAAAQAETKLSQIFGPEIELCPDWLNMQDPERQAILLLAAVFGITGVTDARTRLNYAEMAPELFRLLQPEPSIEDILGPQPGDYETLESTKQMA